MISTNQESTQSIINQLGQPKYCTRQHSPIKRAIRNDPRTNGRKITPNQKWLCQN